MVMEQQQQQQQRRGHEEGDGQEVQHVRKRRAVNACASCRASKVRFFANSPFFWREKDEVRFWCVLWGCRVRGWRIGWGVCVCGVCVFLFLYGERDRPAGVYMVVYFVCVYLCAHAHTVHARRAILPGSNHPRKEKVKREKEVSEKSQKKVKKTKKKKTPSHKSTIHF